jgi:hypothetical protein
MNNKKGIAILVFLLSVTIPILTLSLFPTPCGYGLCLMIYFPIIFLVGGLSSLTWYIFVDRIKLNRTILFSLIVFIDFLLLSYYYPRGEYFPINQIRVASQVADKYKYLEPIDIFKATEERNFLLTTALYHKFNLPTDTYEVKYCLLDEKGRCDTILKKFNYYISADKVVTNNSDFHFKLDLEEDSFSFTDTVETINFTFKVGYSDFGKYRKTFTNTSSELTDSGERVTGLVKDIGDLRVIVHSTRPKIEYGFTRLFEKYLSLTK